MNMRIILVWLGVLAAVAGGCDRGMAPLRVDEPASSQATADSEWPPALWVQSRPNASGDTLTLVDPIQLRELPDREPLAFGHILTWAASPDGRQLALVDMKEDGQQGDVRLAQLHLIDLASGRESGPPVDIPLTFVNDRIDHLFFARDGEALFWIKPLRDTDATGQVGPSVLYRFALPHGPAEEAVRLPDQFVPRSFRLLDGGRLAVYGEGDGAAKPAGEPLDPPRVLVVNPEAGRIEADVTLSGMEAGFRTLDANVPLLKHAYPGLAWDDQQSLLYVVHPDAERISVVDLKNGRVIREADIRKKRSLLDVLFGWLLPGAHAKMVNGMVKQAVISPDGAYLYVTGKRYDDAWTEDGQPVWQQTPLGLSVIDTAEFREVRRIDLPVDRADLSPDGTRLLLEQNQYVTDGKNSQQTSGLYLFHVDEWEELYRAVTENGDMYGMNGYSPDGRYAFITRYLDDGGGCVVQVLDLSRGEVVAEQTFQEGWVSFGPVTGMRLR